MRHSFSILLAAATAGLMFVLPSCSRPTPPLPPRPDACEGGKPDAVFSVTPWSLMQGAGSKTCDGRMVRFEAFLALELYDLNQRFSGFAFESDAAAQRFYRGRFSGKEIGPERLEVRAERADLRFHWHHVVIEGRFRGPAPGDLVGRGIVTPGRLAFRDADDGRRYPMLHLFDVPSPPGSEPTVSEPPPWLVTRWPVERRTLPFPTMMCWETVVE